jgi:tetratricopeptide (TPR) repeat protein
MAHFLVQLRRFEDAEQAYADVRASFEQALGSSASIDADIELHLGLLDLARGEHDAAEARFGRARGLYAPLVDPSTSSISLLELAEAKLAFLRGDRERARQGFGRVVDIGVDDLRRAEAWEALGVIRFYSGDMPGSLDAYRRARILRLATLGPEHPSLGILQSNIGESLAASGDHRGALEAYADALALLERVLPPDHADLAFPYKGRAQSRLALGDPAGARVDLERALRLHEANPGEPVERADVEHTLARVLLASGEGTRALELARAAHQRLVDLGHHEAAAAITTWIHEQLEHHSDR